MLRTRELWTRMLIPSMVLPVVLGGLVIILIEMKESEQRDRVVALSTDTPEELPVAIEYEADGWQVLWVDDPQAAVSDGRADLGVGPWIPGPGLGTRLGERLDLVVGDAGRVGVSRSDRYLWTVHVWETEDTRGDAKAPLDEVEDGVFEGLVAAQGLPSREVAWPIFLHRLKPKSEAAERDSPLPVLLGHPIQFCDLVHCLSVSVISLLGYLVMLFGTFADRGAGIFETQSTLAVPAWVVFLSRALAMVFLLTAATLVLFLPVFGFEGVVDSESRGWAEVVSDVLASCILVTSLVLPSAILSQSGQQAASIGGYSIIVAMFAGGAVIFVPSWVALLAASLVLLICVFALDWMDGLNRAARLDPQ